MENLILEALRKRESDLVSQLEVTRSMIASELKLSGHDVNSKVPIKEVEADADNKITTAGNSSSELAKESHIHKFVRVLKENQRFMRIREMSEYIVSQEGGDITVWMKKLTPKTAKLQRSNKIIKKQIGDSKVNTFWGSPNWLDNKGDIKEEFMFDESSLSEGRTTSLDDIEL